jgi:hypothetical protein
LDPGGSNLRLGSKPNNITIFVFSNKGGKEIAQKTLQQHKDKKARENLTLLEMEEILMMAAFNQKGSWLWLEQILTIAFVYGNYNSLT